VDGGQAVIEVAELGNEVEPTKENFLSFLNVKWLKASPYLIFIFTLEFKDSLHRINASWPHLYLQKPIKVTQDQLVQLSWES